MAAARDAAPWARCASQGCVLETCLLALALLAVVLGLGFGVEEGKTRGSMAATCRSFLGFRLIWGGVVGCGGRLVSK